MKGYVETPSRIVDLMVGKLFETRPSADTTVLDPGCGTGAFIEGILRWCRDNNAQIPKVLGIDSDSRHLLVARSKFAQISAVSIANEDFLARNGRQYDFIIGNPPYVPITELSREEKESYRAKYTSAVGRFDLYLLFFERALSSLKSDGRLVFITPEKFLYVETAQPLRRLLSSKFVDEIQMVEEKVFGDLLTYPTITTITNRPGPARTSLILRDGVERKVTFPINGSSWLPYMSDRKEIHSNYVLEDICVRISCGVATGADSVYICNTSTLPSDLKPFAYPTLGGRDLADYLELKSSHSMLVPYNKDGSLVEPDGLGALMVYLSRTQIRKRLENRTCVSHKPWYAFHENPPLNAILRPKLLTKDITHRPHFWVDRDGSIVPRHSIYYLVPKDPSRLDQIASFLNSMDAREWLERHCQRAANGFLRVQSHVLKHMPIPPELSKPPIAVPA